MNNKKKKVPKFKSIEEEAHFWDTHDTMDYSGEFKPVKATIRRMLDRVLPVRFDSKTINSLEKYASEKGVGTTTLIRMWILERLKNY